MIFPKVMVTVKEIHLTADFDNPDNPNSSWDIKKMDKHNNGSLNPGVHLVFSHKFKDCANYLGTVIDLDNSISAPVRFDLSPEFSLSDINRLIKVGAIKILD